MKIKHKIFPIISVGVISITPVISSASCSCVFELNLTEQEQYIYDRTFSIYGKNDNRLVMGTGWIISDATKSNNDDYCYWMATNWHVIHGIENIYGLNQMFYGDNSLTNMTPYIPYESYLPFKSFVKESEENFLYEQSISSWVPAIDLSVCKVDFGSPKGDIKTKLDKLNQCQKTNGYINKFAKDNNETRGKDKIIGGYFLKKDSSTTLGGQWEAHSFGANNLAYHSKGDKYDGSNCGHAIGNPFYDQKGNERSGGDEIFPYWDISPQFVFTTKMNKDFMPGGASGSMMITSDYEVCGLYWGGWESGDVFYPAFSIFNTEEINFLAKYI